MPCTRCRAAGCSGSLSHVLNDDPLTLDQQPKACSNRIPEHDKSIRSKTQAASLARATLDPRWNEISAGPMVQYNLKKDFAFAPTYFVLDVGVLRAPCGVQLGWLCELAHEQQSRQLLQDQRYGGE
mmetsp:Transcript_10934/g.25707  ORF Transcript_10934/g.25707 Transcript_10934/m.25707 type:complete len:126 (-) Transcript_10934:129-506(-)